MKRLVSYVSAIHRLSSPVAVVRQATATECWPDQGFEVSKTVTTYCFDNDVVIRQTIEQDTFPSDLACAECWINYEVITHGGLDGQVSPSRQVFANACRESFWLSYHRT